MAQRRAQWACAAGAETNCVYSAAAKSDPDIGLLHHSAAGHGLVLAFLHSESSFLAPPMTFACLKIGIRRCASQNKRSKAFLHFTGGIMRECLQCFEANKAFLTSDVHMQPFAREMAWKMVSRCFS